MSPLFFLQVDIKHQSALAPAGLMPRHVGIQLRSGTSSFTSEVFSSSPQRSLRPRTTTSGPSRASWRAVLLADAFDGSVLGRLAHGHEAGAALVVLGDPLAGEGAVLNFRQHRPHILADVLVNDAVAAAEGAVLGSVADREVHIVVAALVHQVYDHLQLVQALEVGDFLRVSQPPPASRRRR